MGEREGRGQRGAFAARGDSKNLHYQDGRRVLGPPLLGGEKQLGLGMDPKGGNSQEESQNAKMV